MIYAKSIAWSSAEGFRSKTRTQTFDKLVTTLKKLFLTNVAAKVAITPKNSEKSCFCFLMVIFGDLCQNKKKHQNFGQSFPFPEFFTETVRNFQKCYCDQSTAVQIAVIIAGLDFVVLP